jgi:hypothetical protein
MDTGASQSLCGRHALGGIYLNLTHYGRLAGKSWLDYSLACGVFCFAFGVAAAHFTVLTGATDCNCSFYFSSSRRQAIWATLASAALLFQTI